MTSIAAVTDEGSCSAVLAPNKINKKKMEGGRKKCVYACVYTHTS
jgi:hypothetical protein